MKRIKNIAGRTVYSVRNFTQDPIENLGFLIPVVMALISVISAVVGYILFIVHGGYLNQVSLIKEQGTDGITQGFTSGSAGILTSGNIPKVIWLLFLTQMIIMLISYFINAGKAKRIIMIVDLVVLAFVVILFVIVFSVAIGSLIFSEEELLAELTPFEGMKVNLRAILITYAVLAFVSIITFIVMILISDCRWMLGYALLSVIVNYIAATLVVLLFENIIPLVVGAVLIVIVGGIICFAIKVIFTGGEGGSDSVGGSSSGGFFSDSSSNKKVNTGNLSERGEKKRQAGELVQEETCAYVPDLNSLLGFKLYKVHGLTEDYVESDNGVATRRLCSVEQLRKGKFHIYESKSGREVREQEIPWRK